MMQAGKDYGVEVLVAYENKKVGQVIFPPGVLRQALVQRGFARRLSAVKADATATSTKPTTRRKQDAELL